MWLNRKQSNRKHMERGANLKIVYTACKKRRKSVRLLTRPKNIADERKNSYKTIPEHNYV